MTYYYTAKCKQSQGVWNNHKIIEHIRQLPNQIVGQAGAHENKANSNYRENLYCRLAHKVLYVNLCKEVPAENSGKCEE